MRLNGVSLSESVCVFVPVISISALLSAAKEIEPAQQYAWWIMWRISHWIAVKGNTQRRWRHVTLVPAKTTWSGTLDPGVRWLRRTRTYCIIIIRIVCYLTSVSVCVKCSTECGNGTQTRSVACIFNDNDHMEVVEPSKCSSLPQPATAQPCRLKPCGVQWYVTEWSTVSVPESVSIPSTFHRASVVLNVILGFKGPITDRT